MITWRNSRRLLPLLLAVLSFTVLMMADPESVMASPAADRIDLPPEREQLASPQGDYVFILYTSDHWQSRMATGELYHVAGESRTLLWRRSLPHEFGPRFALVGKQGQVLLLDEWINVKSRYAIMVINRDNDVLAQYDFDQVQNVQDVPGATLVQMANHGLWISSPPTLDALGETATVAAGGKHLVIRLSDGHLSRSTAAAF